jgi:hypothetical protein
MAARFMSRFLEVDVCGVGLYIGVVKGERSLVKSAPGEAPETP